MTTFNPDEDVTAAAMRIGKEMSKDANEAFATFCESHDLDPPTERERLLIKVLSLQLAAAVAKVLEKS